MLRVLRQKVNSTTMALQPYAKRSNFVPVKRAVGVGDEKRYIDLVFWRNGRLVQVAYIPSMNAVVFVDVEKTVKDWEYRFLVSSAVKATARVNKALDTNRMPKTEDVKAMEAVYEIPDSDLMEEYTEVLFDLPPTGGTVNVAGLNEFRNEDKSENKIVFGPIDGTVVVIRISKVLADYQDKFGEHKAGHVSASISAFTVDETLGAEEPKEEIATETKKVEVIKSTRARKVS